MDESLCLWAEGGLEEIGVVTERLNGAGRDELRGTTAVHLIRQETDGRWGTESDVLLCEPIQYYRFNDQENM